jgi:hypothetical protein
MSSLLHTIAAEFMDMDRSTTLSLTQSLSVVVAVIVAVRHHRCPSLSIIVHRSSPSLSGSVYPTPSIHRCPLVAIHPRQRAVFFKSYYYVPLYPISYSSNHMYVSFKIVYRFFKLICISTYSRINTYIYIFRINIHIYVIFVLIHTLT